MGRPGELGYSIGSGYPSGLAVVVDLVVLVCWVILLGYPNRLDCVVVLRWVILLDLAGSA